MWKVLLYLLSVSIESAVCLWLATVGGEYLQERFASQGIHWKNWLLVLAFLKISHSFYWVIRLAYRQEKGGR